MKPSHTASLLASCAAWARRAPAVVAVLALTACGGVQIKPTPKLPQALIVPAPAHVGLVIPGDMRNYTHTETRWGVEWKVDLGEGHTRLMRDVFKYAFNGVQEFPDLESARAANGLKAVFEPRLEQYSFVTARETGGRYYAVTMRYRINLYTPTGELVDSYTLTGYGNALAKGMSSGKPLEAASIAAMRDAAAKFLVQFPEQEPAIQLARNEVVMPPQETPAEGDISEIEAVPIEETDPGERTAAPATPSAEMPQPDAAAPQAAPAS
jgi:hypothetical protein